MLTAIPATYQGVTFRSRLEASWAAHFDKHGLPWVYELEGFQLSDENWYLPDFWLPTARAWAEVKGDHLQRMDKVERFAADLWKESGAKDTYNPRSPMVVLFEVPHYVPEGGRSGGGHWARTSPLGVMGPGKRYSVAFAKCHACGQGTIVALWQEFCRNCGHVCDEVNLECRSRHEWSKFQESVYSYWHDSYCKPKWFQFLRPSRHIDVECST